MSYPINLDIEGKICVVLGGGNVALRKIKGLLAAGGKVINISSDFCSGIKELAADNKVTLISKQYSVGCLPKGLILIVATNDPEINKLAAMEGAEKNMLVNIVNENDLNINQFTVPSVIRRGDLMLTISTNGKAPALSKSIRQHLEEQFNENFYLMRHGDNNEAEENILNALDSYRNKSQDCTN